MRQLFEGQSGRTFSPIPKLCMAMQVLAARSRVAVNIDYQLYYCFPVVQGVAHAHGFVRHLPTSRSNVSLHTCVMGKMLTLTMYID